MRSASVSAPPLPATQACFVFWQQSSSELTLTLFRVVNNLRLKIDRAAIALEDLASKGPLKPEGLRGLNEDGYAEYLKSEDITVTDGLK